MPYHFVFYSYDHLKVNIQTAFIFLPFCHYHLFIYGLIVMYFKLSLKYYLPLLNFNLFNKHIFAYWP